VIYQPECRGNELNTPLLVRKPTTGAMKSGLKASTISCGQIVLVIAVPAEGAIVLARIPYLMPSVARVRVKPMTPAFAVEY